MRCSRCGRALRESAIPSGSGGYAALGPKCARLVGLGPQRKVMLFTVRRRVRMADARQMEIPV